MYIHIFIGLHNQSDPNLQLCTPSIPVFFACIVSYGNKKKACYSTHQLRQLLYLVRTRILSVLLSASDALTTFWTFVRLTQTHNCDVKGDDTAGASSNCAL